MMLLRPCLSKKSLEEFKSARVSLNVSVDRINSHKGYTPKNVQLVTAWANSLKSDLTADELGKFASRIYKFNNANKQVPSIQLELQL